MTRATQNVDLPKTLSKVAEIENAYELELEDGSTFAMSGMRVLAVYMKYSRDEWGRWVAAARDKIAECYYERSVPQKFGSRDLKDDEDEMADIAEDVLYYGDLRAATMQLALMLLGNEDGEEPVEVVGLTSNGPDGQQRTYDTNEVDLDE